MSAKYLIVHKNLHTSVVVVCTTLVSILVLYRQKLSQEGENNMVPGSLPL